MTNSKTWLLIAGSALFFVLIYLLSPVLTPFLVAALLAYLFNPIVNKLTTLKLSRTLAVLVVFLVFILIVLNLILFLIPLIEQQISLLIKQIPYVIDWVQHTFIPWLSHKFGIQDTLQLDSVKSTLTQHWQQGGSVISQVMSTVTKSGLAIVAFGTNLVLIPLVAFYLLRDWQKLVDGLQDLLPRSVESTITGLVKDCHEVLGAFFRGQLLVMFGLGIIYALGLWLTGLQLALLIGMLAGVMSIVPYLGFIVGIAAAIIASVMQYHGLDHLWLVAVVFAVGQMAESFVLTPLLVGDRIGLHPVAVIFAILAGGQLFGFVGVLLALPVAAVIMVLIRHFHQRYLDSDMYGTTQSEKNL